MPQDPDQLRDFARRYTEAWCSKTPERVAEHYAPGGSLTINGGTPSVGRVAITEAAQSFMTTFPDMELLMDDLIVRDDGAAEYHWTLAGMNSGPGGTGNRVRISGFEEWKIRGGLVAESQGHFDQAEYDRQVEHGVNEAG